jgi:uncharacterized protein (TIGR00730 family)
VKRICVFCGSSPGATPVYTQAAREMGQLLAHKQLGLVYGGGHVGLMGEMAAAALKAGGEVIGVIPRDLADRGLAYTALPDLRLVGSMHERKALMAELADGFVALPGGFGTIEEIVEMLTWSQLGIHSKPCGVVNVAGYFDHLIAFVEHAIAEQFVHPANRSLLLVADGPTALLERLVTYRPEIADKATWALELRESTVRSARGSTPG